MKHTISKTKITSLIGSIFAVILYLIINSNDGTKDVLGDTVIEEDSIKYGQVTRIVDGDTIIIEIDHERIKVRLTGVDTPESVGAYKDNPEYYGKEASRYTQSELLDQWVYLEEDEEAYDKYDRYLAYIWLEEPNIESIRKTCFNAKLLLEGYATTIVVKPNTKYRDVFSGFETEAKQGGIGVWEKKQ